MGEEDRGALRAVKQLEARVLQQQRLIKDMAKFIKSIREGKLLTVLYMKNQAKTLEERAQSAELQS